MASTGDRSVGEWELCWRE